MRRLKIHQDRAIYEHSGIGEKRDIALLEKCQILWENLRYFRERRARAVRYTHGDQWGDLITVHNKTMTQRAYLTSKGNIALQSNQIKNIVNTIAGVWTKEQNEPICQARDTDEQQYGELMTTVLQANWQMNEMKIMMISSLEELIIGGLCITRESYEMRGEISDSWTDTCSPNCIFFDSGMKDPRFWDMSLIGEIHDIEFKEFCEKFCTSATDYEKARKWYSEESSVLSSPVSKDMANSGQLDLIDFYTPYDNTKCRVFEVWQKEVRPMYMVHDPNTGEFYKIKASDTKMVSWINKENAERMKLGKEAGWQKEEIPIIKTQFFMETYWSYKFLTPQGYIIKEGESNMQGRSHPYTICAVPFIDGKITSCLSDAIDHNIAINRALTLDDWMKRTGAKGVSFIPTDLVPDDMSPEEFADQWTSVDGIIFYKPKPGVPEPKQFYGNVGNINTTGIVKLMSDLLEKSVSISGAIQGKTPYSGTSASLYAQQTQNSSTPIATLMARFDSFVKNVSSKKVKNIQQNYDTKRYETIAGKIDDRVFENVNFEKAGNIEYDLAIVQSPETPVYRMIANDMLMEFWRSGAVELRDALELSSFPFKDKLIQKMDSKENITEAAQTAAPVITNTGVI